ncbi:hypothetical protein PR048_025762 [Dryococelus australis]|uniref:Uncharacterized protein n=1 Tax=Dryococelus australis TaxID=614101 RepID=A0ABQ9GJF3_9NEOP|nr:hypothetical protein PR048_025762 [Dryococelus australis]
MCRYWLSAVTVEGGDWASLLQEESRTVWINGQLPSDWTLNPRETHVHSSRWKYVSWVEERILLRQSSQYGELASVLQRHTVHSKKFLKIFHFNVLNRGVNAHCFLVYCYQCPYIYGTAVAEPLARLPLTKAIRAQSPAGSPDPRKGESYWTMPSVDGSSRGSPVSPDPSFRHRSIFTSIALIGSQDLAVKSLPDLFTHSQGLIRNVRRYLEHTVQNIRNEIRQRLIVSFLTLRWTTHSRILSRRSEEEDEVNLHSNLTFLSAVPNTGGCFNKRRNFDAHKGDNVWLPREIKRPLRHNRRLAMTLLKTTHVELPTRRRSEVTCWRGRRRVANHWSSHTLPTSSNLRGTSTDRGQSQKYFVPIATLHCSMYFRTSAFCSMTATSVCSHGSLAVIMLSFHQGEPGSIPDRVTPRFSHVGIVPDDAAGRWVFFSGIPCFPRPFIPSPLHTHLNHPNRLSRHRC